MSVISEAGVFRIRPGAFFALLPPVVTPLPVRYGRDPSKPRALFALGTEWLAQRIVLRHVFIPWAAIAGAGPQPTFQLPMVGLPLEAEELADRIRGGVTAPAGG